MDLKVKELVKEVLINKPVTRGDDFILISEVLKYYVDGDTPIAQALQEHKEHKLPSFASIIRFRRYIQLENKDLLPQKEIVEIRNAEEEKYLDLARGVNIN